MSTCRVTLSTEEVEAGEGQGKLWNEFGKPFEAFEVTVAFDWAFFGSEEGEQGEGTGVVDVAGGDRGKAGEGLSAVVFGKVEEGVFDRKYLRGQGVGREGVKQSTGEGGAALSDWRADDAEHGGSPADG